MSHSTTPDQPQHQYYDDEIDLKELVIKLWQRKLWIIVATAVIASLSLIYTQITPAVFSIEVEYRLPLVAQEVILSKYEINSKERKNLAERVLNKLNNEEYIKRLVNSGEKLSYLREFDEPAKELDLKVIDFKNYSDLLTSVHISMEAIDPEFGTEVLLYVINNAISDSESELLKEIEISNELQISMLQEELLAYENAYTYSKDIEWEQFGIRLADVRMDIEMQKLLSPSTEVIALGSVAVLEDEEPKKVRPRAALIIALGIILGLMLGSFLALVVPVREGK